jgi:catechol 2,3-dioxygenase-like lactoylglutathione lyase family enzyme
VWLTGIGPTSDTSRPTSTFGDIDAQAGDGGGHHNGASKAAFDMKRTWTIIGVKDVPLSFRWYQTLFGQPVTSPGHDYWGQILDSDGTVLLCLHQWGSHDHPSLKTPSVALPGNGLLLFFRVDDFDMSLRRARTLVSRLDEEPAVNAATGTREFALGDPDGYCVIISELG